MSYLKFLIVILLLLYKIYNHYHILCNDNGNIVTNHIRINYYLLGIF